MPDFKQLLQKPRCTVISNASRLEGVGNSILRSIPEFGLANIFSRPDLIHVTASFVELHGKSEEPAHFHTSHLIAVVVRGDGQLRTGKGIDVLTEHGKLVPNDGVVVVMTGDVVVIPRGENHFFDPNTSGMSYVGLEISDQLIDYQKHFSLED